jgi:hypothetical protein
MAPSGLESRESVRAPRESPYSVRGFSRPFEVKTRNAAPIILTARGRRVAAAAVGVALALVVAASSMAAAAWDRERLERWRESLPAACAAAAASSEVLPLPCRP